MPLKSYAALHASAKVSKAEITTLKKYVSSLPSPGSSVTSKASAVSTTTASTAPRRSSPWPRSPNGISYTDDYRNWQVIATTNRFDNGTLRIIYGNDIAVKALQQNNINPWPNGAKIVKVVWNKQPEDADGNVHTGSFNNIQFMIRDDKRFNDTGGWGFARFSTPELIPYGKTATFATTCFNCHRLASANGFVFDVPTKLGTQL